MPNVIHYRTLYNNMQISHDSMLSNRGHSGYERSNLRPSLIGWAHNQNDPLGNRRFYSKFVVIANATNHENQIRITVIMANEIYHNAQTISSISAGNFTSRLGATADDKSWGWYTAIPRTSSSEERQLVTRRRGLI